MTFDPAPMRDAERLVRPEPSGSRWRLGAVCDGRDNNFNLIRMVAAACVIVSHAFPIALGAGTLEPLQASTGHKLGSIAVAIFFAISGFLITRSFDRTSRLSRWISARVMRLFPGLAVVVILTAAFYGPALTTLEPSAYFARAETYSYVPRNLSLAFLQFELPGVIADNPYPGAINGSLWTLVHEVACYFGVFLLGVFGALRSRRGFPLFCAAYLALFVATMFPEMKAQLPAKILAFRDLSYPFVLGMMLYHWRDRIVLSWVAVAILAVLAAALRGTLLFDLVFVAAISYTAFVLAYRVGGMVREYNRLGDYSYGLYIYGFPVQQAVVALGWSDGPVENMMIAFPIALGLAILSWYLVEHPALERRHRVADWFDGGLATTSAAREGVKRA